MNKRNRLLTLLLTAALLASLALFLFQQNFALQVEQVELTFEALPPEFDGLRVAELSDLHGRSFGRGNARLLDALRQAQPDLICLCGDIFDENTDVTMLEPLLHGLVGIAPVYYVTGNHEWRVPGLRVLLRQMRALGVTVLQNEYRVLTRGASSLCVAGVDDPCGPYDKKTPAQLVRELRQREGEAFVLMLSHRNDELPLWAHMGVQTVLCGHGHGGIVRLPGIGAVFGTHMDLFPDYTAGLYEKDGTAMVVSRGLGGSRKLPLRIGNRPEVVTVVLQTEN